MVCSRKGEMGMEVVIKGHADPAILMCGIKNLYVVGSFQAEFANMNGIPTLFAEDSCRDGREPLIQENAFHATRSILMSWSSTVTAA